MADATMNTDCAAEGLPPAPHGARPRDRSVEQPSRATFNTEHVPSRTSCSNGASGPGCSLAQASRSGRSQPQRPVKPPKEVRRDGCSARSHRSASCLICSKPRIDCDSWPFRTIIAASRSSGSNAIALATAERSFITPWLAKTTISSGSRTASIFRPHAGRKPATSC
jgi:hypothetical protein